MSFKSAIESIDPKKESLITLDQKSIDAIHSRFIELLQDFDAFCSARNISWSLAGGSMLGAIRHRGFIPWDDDIDIHMERKEYDRFKELIQNDLAFCKKYDLKNPGDPGYMYHFPKLYIKDTVFREVQSNDRYPNSMFMDIFILEDTPNSKLLNYIHALKCLRYMFICSVVRVRECRDTLLKHSKNSHLAHRAILSRSRLGFWFSYRKLASWCGAANSCFSKIKNADSTYIVIPGGARHYFGEMYRRDYICPTKRVAFENLCLPVPKEAERILEQRYGEDYMKIPPEDKRAKHSIIELKL